MSSTCRNITLMDIHSPYTRDTYRYTPLLALLLVPNIFFHPSFGKYLFAAFDIINGIIIYNLLTNHILPKPASKNEKNSEAASTADLDLKVKATLYTAIHLLNPMVFSISTRGSSESVLSLFVLLTLHAVLNERWVSAAIFLGLSTHWKIYPVIYGVSCICLIGSLSPYATRKCDDAMGWLKMLVNPRTIKFALVSAATFVGLGGLCYIMCVASLFSTKEPCLTTVFQLGVSFPLRIIFLPPAPARPQTQLLPLLLSHISLLSLPYSTNIGICVL